jgi:tetratricopeptide (TPR) repeat protein
VDQDSATSQIQELLALIDQIYWGPQERALIDDALHLAQTNGNDELEYKVRMRLTASAARTGDNDTLLSSFAWCLAKHDGDPERFPTSVGEGLVDLMWQFTWVAEAFDASTTFSLADCEALLNQMEEHYRGEGFSLSAVAAARFHHAWQTGRLEEAEEWLEVLSATPRDEHSRCEACGRSQLAGFAAATGDDELALRLVDEIVEGGFSCGEEPEHALSRTLIAKLRAGRSADALAGHQRSYDRARNNPDAITIVADNLVFCAITGNEARGLALVERHLPWLTVDPLNQSGQLDLLVAIAMACEATQAVGHGDQTIRGVDGSGLVDLLGAHDGPWTVERLAPAARAAATRLARRFDGRNQNMYVSSQVTRTFELAREHYDVPMNTDVFLPPLPSAPQPVTAQDWLELAEVHVFADRPLEAVAAARHVLEFDQPVSAPATTPAAPDADPATTDPGVRARAAQLMIGCLVQLDLTDEAMALLPVRRIALLEKGRAEQAEVEQRLGLSAFGALGRQDVARLEAEAARLDGQAGPELADVELTLGLALLQRARQHDDEPQAQASDARRDATSGTTTAGAPYVESSGDRVLDLLTRAVAHAASRPALRSSALRGLALVQAGIGDLVGSLASATQALETTSSPGLRAALLRHRARTLGGLARFEEGARDADEATKIYAAYRVSDQVVANAMLAAALFADAGRIDEEVLRLRYALREAALTEAKTTMIRFRLGHALRRAGQIEQALPLLLGVRQEERRACAPAAEQAETASALADALEQAGSLSEAAAMYADAAEQWVSADAPIDAAAALHRQGTLLRQLGTSDQAIDVLSQAWQLARERDETTLQVMILEGCALAKSEVGDDSALHDIDRCVELTMGDPDPMAQWKLADLEDTRARVLLELRRGDEAAQALAKAAQLFTEQDDLLASLSSRHLLAQVLARPLKRPAEAVEVWKAALSELDSHNATTPNDGAVASTRLRSTEWTRTDDAGGSAALDDDTQSDWVDLRASMLVLMADTLDRLGRFKEAAEARAANAAAG